MYYSFTTDIINFLGTIGLPASLTGFIGLLIFVVDRILGARAVHRAKALELQARNSLSHDEDEFRRTILKQIGDLHAEIAKRRSELSETSDRLMGTLKVNIELHQRLAGLQAEVARLKHIAGSSMGGEEKNPDPEG